jgi:hypothetical protein
VRSQDCETDPKARRELEDFAVSHLQYVWAHNGVVSAANAVLNPTAGAQHGPHGRACFIDEHYKRDVIGAARNPHPNPHARRLTQSRHLANRGLGLGELGQLVAMQPYHYTPEGQSGDSCDG